MIETALSISHYVLLAGTGILVWLNYRLRCKIAADLAEMHLCNREFSEAVALLQYGAVDEAIEMSQRWKVRAEARERWVVGQSEFERP